MGKRNHLLDFDAKRNTVVSVSSRLCQVSSKSDKNRDIAERRQTDTQTEMTQRAYNLSHAML